MLQLIQTYQVTWSSREKSIGGADRVCTHTFRVSRPDLNAFLHVLLSNNVKDVNISEAVNDIRGGERTNFIDDAIA